MRIDLPANDSWNALSEQYRSALPFQDSALQVQVYLGYQHALLEVTQGLARLFSHKKTIAIVGSVEPAFETIAVTFAPEGFTIKSATPAEIADPAWLDPLQKDLLFVLYSADDPVTGLVHDGSGLETALKDKRVFRISVSHALHRFQPQTRPQPFEVRVLSLRTDRALLVAGERCRIQPQLAARLPWVMDSLDSIERDLAVYSQEQILRWKSVVEEFESSLPDGFEPIFQKSASRLYDRTAFFHPGFDGSAIASELARELGFGMNPPGADGPVETTSPCRWTNPRLARWLLSEGLTEEQVRGAVIASADLLGNDPENFEIKLEAATEKIRRLQEGP